MLILINIPIHLYMKTTVQIPSLGPQYQTHCCEFKSEPLSVHLLILDICQDKQYSKLITAICNSHTGGLK